MMAQRLGLMVSCCAVQQSSIDVLLVAPLFLELGDEGDGLVDRSGAMRSGHIDKRALHVLAHGYGATDIDMGAVGDPRPQIAADLAHAILDIEFLFAVARPSERETSKRAGGFHSGQLVFVEEIVITPLVAEEQPVAARSLRRHALVQERTKRRDSGPGPDHDYWHGR